ncbi:hypothetical protein [Variovorax davisae]|uniref:hypothetical protein n=1 Tax=Variovorax davisae TaxID=3053515 RepID=UPI002578C347|nr:hypothetical protein [Variovorax sp. J22P271]
MIMVTQPPQPLARAPLRWASVVLAAAALGAHSPATEAQPAGCNYGPDTCAQGYVWREADGRDHVCVKPEIRAQTAAENRAAPTRVAGSGAYGPNTCRQGFVWREAFRGDVVCVIPEARAQAASDNAQAARRRACRQ